MSFWLKICLLPLVLMWITCTTKIGTILPEPSREFRAAWIASVANINWPSKPGLPVEIQKEEAIRWLDLLDTLNFNAAILQVRPQCDALYQSSIEPWSYYLTGSQGMPPDPFYDPLEFWVEEAHHRGIELHVWLNPYRANHPSGQEVTEYSVVKRKPDLVVELEDGYWWMDPGHPQTPVHSTQVVMDLVSRYDIDGVHFDDYFYPYPSYNGGHDFPDQKSWSLYLRRGGNLSRDDWRRENVNLFIKNLYKSIKKEKPHVKFGLSPFGIWRPGNPSSIQGFDQYDQIYADARLWLKKGWIDYFSPQLYWPINQIPQSFPVLLNWWEKQNKKGRHIWPGISIGRNQRVNGPDETINQIMISRAILEESPGVVHWSIGTLGRQPDLTTALKQGPYMDPALPPGSCWLSTKNPASPTSKYQLKGDSIILSWVPSVGEQIAYYVLYLKYGDLWNAQIIPGRTHSLKVEISRMIESSGAKSPPGDSIISKLNAYAVLGVNRFGILSKTRKKSIKSIKLTDAVLKVDLNDRKK